jgi:hypothetical protein
MMDILFEQRVIQNTALASETIWQAVHEAHEAKKRISGVPFPLVFLVLPLTFHRRTAKVLASKAQPGAIYKALADDRELTVGLQERMQAMSDRTYQALSAGFQTDLLKFDSDTLYEVFPGRKSSPIDHVTDDVKTIFAAAKRVGRAFSEMSVVQLSTQLNIRF